MNIKRKRLAVGLSQLELSRRAGVSRWRLNLAERGGLELRKDELSRIERVLKRRAKQAARAALEQGAQPSHAERKKSPRAPKKGDSERPRRAGSSEVKGAPGEGS